MKNYPTILFPYIFSMRLLASTLSIAGAYLFVFDFLNATIKQSLISYFLTTLFLVFIELGSIVFLISFFRLIKNYIKNRSELIITSLFFLTATGFLSLSFFLTTKGASQWVAIQNESSIVNNKTELLPRNESTYHYNELLKTAQLKFDSLSKIQVHRFKTVRIQQINKLEYYKNQVDYYQKLMTEEKAESKDSIQKSEEMNRQFIHEYSEKYYGFAVLIMILVFISNFLIFYLKDLNTNNIINKNNAIIHEYNICNSSPCTNQVEDILKSDLSKTEKIYALFKANYSQHQIAEYLNISQSTVSRSLNGII